MLKLKESVKVNLVSSNDGKLMWILSAVVAFVGAFGKISGFPSSMNVVVSVIFGANFIPAFIGSVVSYVLQGSWESGIAQICSILVIGAVRSLLAGRKQSESPGFLAILTSGVLILFNAVMSVAMSAGTYVISMSMITSLFFGCIVFIAKTIIFRRDYEGIVELSGLNGMYGGVLYIAVIATLSALPIPIFNLGRALGCFAILCGARKYRYAGGAVMGALTTCGVLLCEPTLAKNTLLLATSGLICGTFIHLGLLTSVLSFLGLSVVSLVAIGINGDTFFMFADMILGSVIFVAVPVSLIKTIAGRVMGARNSVDLVGQTASARLNFASRTLSDIRSQLTLISSAIDRKNKEVDLKKQVCLAVCGECPKFNQCWKENKQSSLKAFAKLEDTIIKFNCISNRDIDLSLPKCKKPYDMEFAFNQLYKEYLAQKANNIHIKEMRELLSEQLCSMEDILGDLSYRVGQVRAIDSNLSSQVRDYFERLGYPNAKACVYIDENRTQRAEIFITSEFAGDIIKLTANMGAIVECDFDFPTIIEADGVTKITFIKQPEYLLDVGTFQASCEENENSGDSFDLLSLNAQEQYVILSDGMGTGKRARLDSMFTVNLIKRLLKTGVSMSTAHRMINSILRVKGWEESFATVDLLKLDLCGGTAEFLKSGASCSCLYRDGVLTQIGGQAFPAGILSDCIPDVSSVKFFCDDTFIMTSDGVDYEVVKNIVPFSENNNVSGAKDMAQALGELATENREMKKSDDITIIVIKIKSNN